MTPAPMPHVRPIRTAPCGRRRQRGAALLLAMLILTLVATLAAGMVWQQWRAIQVETAERARSQAAWMLAGAFDWARLVLRADALADHAANTAWDHLGEPWATPLAESRLSTFVVGEGGADESGGIDAFLSGSIVDAQSRYNLMRLAGSPEAAAAANELRVLVRLCDIVGVPSDVALRIARQIRAAAIRSGELEGDASGIARDAPTQPPILPGRVSELSWLGIEPEVVSRLAPYVEILPDGGTKVNLNTAPAEVLAAVADQLDRASAERLVQVRLRQPFRSVAEAQALVPNVTLSGDSFGVASSYFELRGRVRSDDMRLEERSIVRREGNDVTLVRRERVHAEAAP